MLKPCQGPRTLAHRRGALKRCQAAKKKPGTMARLAPQQGEKNQPRTCLSKVSASLTAKPPPFSSLNWVTTPSLTSIE